MALPLTILISSVLVFGDMSEKYEISSFKSAGVSLVRMMMPGLAVAFLVAGFSFVASNILKPAANFQFQKRFIALRNQKSALALEEGIFNNAFNDVILRISDINKDGRRIEDIMVYDHTANDKSHINITKAKSGLMYTEEEGKVFVMELDSGVQYLEIEQRNNLGETTRKYPFMRTYFKQWTKALDMSGFQFDEGMIQFSRNKEDMLNTMQLFKSLDSFDLVIEEQNEKSRELIKGLFNIDSIPDKETINKPLVVNGNSENPGNSDLISLENDSKRSKNKVLNQRSTAYIELLPRDSIPAAKSLHELIPLEKRFDILSTASINLSTSRDRLTNYTTIRQDYLRAHEKYELNLHQQFSWALVCILFLFIGAPLGSIIKKGGYGYPLLVAILFYMIFIISNIYGMKMVRSENLDGTLAAWMPVLVLAPFGFILTLLALRDKHIQNVGFTLPAFFKKAQNLSKRLSVF
jgi:lipopolysaccharide export system permease protein